MKCVYVHEMCLWEKRGGDKVGINSGGCAKFAYLLEKHLFKRARMCEVLGCRQPLGFAEVI